VWIKFMVEEAPADLSDAAADLVRRALAAARLIAPAFAWAEIGSVLRKKVRQGLLHREQAETLWASLAQLPIEFVDTPALRGRTWLLAAQYGLPTLYDAAFLACVETAPLSPSTVCEFWTADQELLRALGSNRPAYVRQLGRATPSW
jgi:predicted nucleic acid-binding protein